MKELVKTILGLRLSEEEKELLDILKRSNIPRKVVGRGTLTLDVNALYKSEQFKHYQKLAKNILN